MRLLAASLLLCSAFAIAPALAADCEPLMLAHHSCEWRCQHECSPQTTPIDIAGCVEQCLTLHGFRCSHCGHDGCR